MRALRDPWTRSVVLAVGLVVAGFVALGAAAVGASQTPSVPEQVAFLVSGGFGGLALAGTGLALLDVQRSRRVAAEDRRDLAAVAADLGALADGIAARRLHAARPVRPGRPTRRPRRVLRAR